MDRNPVLSKNGTVGKLKKDWKRKSTKNGEKGRKEGFFLSL